MTSPLRVGIIGLGPRWRKQYRPALRGLRDRYQVSAVCDQIHDRAARTARKLGCVPAGGPTSLVERGDVDAVLLFDPQWYGLWAAELACRAGKAVFCCPPATVTADECEAVQRQAETGGVPVLLGLPLRGLPAATRLRELCAGPLGEPRFVLASTAAAQADTTISQLDVLDWLSTLFGASPTEVSRAAVRDLSALVIPFGPSRCAQLTTYCASGPTPSLRIEVVAQNGRAVLHSFNRVSWTDEDGWHLQRLRTVGRNPWIHLLEQFHRVATAGETPNPGRADLAPLLSHTAPLTEAAPAFC